MFSKLIRKLTESKKEEIRRPTAQPKKDAVQQSPKKMAFLGSFFKERKGLSFFILAILVLLVSTQVRSAIFVILFIAIAAFSKLVQLLFPPSLPIGIDLVSVLLVVLTVVYGPFVGISAALVAYYVGTAMLVTTGRRSDPAVFIIPPLALTITGVAISLLSYGMPGIGYTSIFLYAGAATAMFALYYGAGGLTSFISFLITYIPFHFWIYRVYGLALANLFM